MEVDNALPPEQLAVDGRGAFPVWSQLHIGEGRDDPTAAVIEALLAE